MDVVATETGLRLADEKCSCKIEIRKSEGFRNFRNLPFDRDFVGIHHGHLRQIKEVRSKSVKEGIVRKDANGLVDMDALLALFSRQRNPKFNSLFFRKLLIVVLFIKCDCCSVDLK